MTQKMTEMQAAIGRSVLRKLPAWVETRRQHAATLLKCLSNLSGLRATSSPEYVDHADYKYYAFVRPERLKSGYDRNRIMAEINSSGIPCYSGSCSEIYRENAFDVAGLNPSCRLPVARELGETSLMLLVHPTITMEHIENTCFVVEKVMGKATK